MSTDQVIVIIAILFIIISLYNFFGVLVLLSLMIFLILLLFLFKITSPKEVPKAINYDLILIIALSLAFGVAIAKTGKADQISNLFM